MEFDGEFLEEEFKGLSVDNFHINAKIFFLSHFHWDHCRGLKNPVFKEYFEQNEDVVLYCSTITKELVKKHGELSDNKIFVHEKGEFYFELNGEAIEVTALSAGHCPGSVMYLFESSCNNILFTGDFRLSTNDIELCKPLKSIEIDTIYLDTTFASSSYPNFPNREISFENIAKLINDHLKVNEKYLFYFPIPSYIGYEGLMVQLYQHFRKKIWVHEDTVHQYTSCIKQLVNVITSDHRETNIFFYYKNNKSCLPINEESVPILKIIPSALWFHKFNLDKGPVQKMGINEWRVAYSNHASLEELVYFVEWIKPKKIVPIAKATYVTKNEVESFSKLEHVEMLKEIESYSKKGQEEEEEPAAYNYFAYLSKTWKEGGELVDNYWNDLFMNRL